MKSKFSLKTIVVWHDEMYRVSDVLTDACDNYTYNLAEYKSGITIHYNIRENELEPRVKSNMSVIKGRLFEMIEDLQNDIENLHNDINTQRTTITKLRYHYVAALNTVRQLKTMTFWGRIKFLFNRQSA